VVPKVRTVDRGKYPAFAAATERSLHLDEMMISIRGSKYWLWRVVDNEGEVLDFLVQRRRDAQAAKKLMMKLLKKHGFAPSRIVTDRLRSYSAAFRAIGTCEQTTGRRTRISRYGAENENCSGSNRPDQPNVSSPFMPPHSTLSLTNVICCADRISRSFALVHSARGLRHPPPHDACCSLHSPRLNTNNVTKPAIGMPTSTSMLGSISEPHGIAISE